MTTPPWPHTENRATAQIVNMNQTEYVDVFDAIFQTIDAQMSEAFNRSIYVKTLDDSSEPLNHRDLLLAFQESPVLLDAIYTLQDKVSYYLEHRDSPCFGMDLVSQAKTAITRAGGRYQQRIDFERNESVGITVWTPDGWWINS